MSYQPSAMSYILLTIDVEDWFQVENFKQCIPFSSWPSRELRVEKILTASSTSWIQLN